MGSEECGVPPPSSRLLLQAHILALLLLVDHAISVKVFVFVLSKK